jgi:signal transduction histidine kinase
MTEASLSPGYPASVVGGELRLPKPPGVVRQFWARHPWLTDSLITALYFVPTFIGMLSFVFTTPGPPLWAGLAQLGTVAASAAAMLFRRSRPWLLMGVAWFGCLVVYPFGSVDVFPVLVALYALAVYRSTRAAWIGFGGSVVVGTVSVYLVPWAQAGDVVDPFDAGAPASALQFAILMLIATLIGVTVGNRRRYLNALIARAHDLARERDQQAQLAAAAERARIAREMHDIVSHGLTVMITLAEGSAATAGRDADRAATAMRSVADTGREALDEMRRMLGVLNGPDDMAATLTPQPDTAAIPDLVEGFREAGLPVRLTTVGASIGEPALQLAVYRIVQEGLTNALRHGGRAQRVDVRIAQTGETVEVTVEDDAPPRAEAATPGAGRGLAGLRERVALFGGALEAGALPERGWRLHASLRIRPTPTEEHG